MILKRSGVEGKHSPPIQTIDIRKVGCLIYLIHPSTCMSYMIHLRRNPCSSRLGFLPVMSALLVPLLMVAHVAGNTTKMTLCKFSKGFLNFASKKQHFMPFKFDYNSLRDHLPVHVCKASVFLLC